MGKKYKDKLVDYVVNVNKDHKMLKKHNKDPEDAAKNYGLSDDDVELIKNNDTKAIAKRCKDAGVDLEDLLLATFHTP